MVEKKIIITSGKRKTAIARASTRRGKGVIRINSILLDVLEPKLARDKIKEILFLAGKIPKNLNIKVSVQGGGWQAQAEAARTAIARALVEWSGNIELKKRYGEYNKHILVPDTRRTEPQKPYRSAARSKRQKSKR